MRLSNLVLIPVIATTLFLGCENKKDIKWKQRKEPICKALGVNYSCDYWGKDYESFVNDFGLRLHRFDSIFRDSLFKEAENFISEFGHDKKKFKKDLGNFYYGFIPNSLNEKDFRNFSDLPKLINLAREFYREDNPGRLEKETELVDFLYFVISADSVDFGYNTHYVVNIGRKLAKDNDLSEYTQKFRQFMKDKEITGKCGENYNLDVGEIK